MLYTIELKPRALRDLRSIDTENTRRILVKIRAMENNLFGDVKRLTDFEPQYRLRIGDYRVLFDIEGDLITVYRVKHRREAY